MLLVLSGSAPAGDDSGRYRLTVKVTGLADTRGEIRAALFASKAEYMRKPLATTSALVNDVDALTLSFDNLPAGEYAVTLYCDENRNGRLDSNFFRIPKEKIGFSNNAWRRFGPAKWKDARFEIAGDDLSIAVRMRRVREKQAAKE